jgi:hypothetical protein
MRDVLKNLATEINYGPLPNVSADQNRLDAILAVVFGIAGAVALLFVVIGGFRYIISRGEPAATAQAKGTIIYAVIGLIVVIVAFSIVSFVLSNI